MKHSAVHEAVATLSVVEGVGWAGCALVATLTLLTTLGQSFPARRQSLICEAIAIGAAVAFALWSMWRASRPFRPSPPWVAYVALAGVALRCLLGLPLHVFFVVVAAAGFAA